MGDESNAMERSMAAIPAPPKAANANPSLRRANSEKTKKPTASPAKANAVQGNSGKSHGCGSLKICTPLMYDSSGHGRNLGRYVVQSGGVAIATAVAAINPAMSVRILATVTSPFPVSQQS